MDKVFIRTPYAPYDKNLGKAYNQEMSLLPDGAWACFIDIDFMFLTPNAGKLLFDYSELVPKNTVLTCYTSRAHEDSKYQLLQGKVSEDSDIKNHIKLAEKQQSELYKLSFVPKDLSGCCIMLNKEMWKTMPFTEDLKCLGVDTDYSIKMRKNNIPLLRMDGIYGWHTYRLIKGVNNKDHIS